MLPENKMIGAKWMFNPSPLLYGGWLNGSEMVGTSAIHKIKPWDNIVEG